MTEVLPTLGKVSHIARPVSSQVPGSTNTSLLDPGAGYTSSWHVSSPCVPDTSIRSFGTCQMPLQAHPTPHPKKQAMFEKEI